MSSVDDRMRAAKRHRDAPYWNHSQPGDPEHTEPERLCLIRNEPLAADETQTCLRCFARTRSALLDVVDLYAELPDHLGVLTGVRTDGAPRPAFEDTALPGGDALAILSGGTPNGVLPSRRGDYTHAIDQHATDPPSAAAVLAGHEDDWRHLHHHGAAPHAPSVASAVEYLLKHLRWASERHPAFDVFADDITRLRSRMQVVTGAHQPPVRADASCFDCGGQLVQVWTDQGLADDRSCEDCGAVYSPARYVLAVAQRIEEQRAEERRPAKAG